MWLRNVIFCIVMSIVVVAGQETEILGENLTSFDQTNESSIKANVVTSNTNETDEGLNSNSTDFYDNDDGVQEDAPRVPGGRKPGKSQPKKKRSPEEDSSLPWAIGGLVFGVVIILLIVLVTIISKPSGNSKLNNSFGHEVENYPDWNGPPTISESISIPSQTDGSVSQGAQSMKEDDFTEYSLASVKEKAKPPAKSVSCEDFATQ